MGFQRIEPDTITLHPFYTLDKEWALLSAGHAGHFNSMTVSWGGMGTLWSFPVVTVYVRPQRYTRVFLEQEDTFSLCFFGGEYKKDLGLLGRISGRDEDKMAQTCLTPCFDNGAGAPMFEQATQVLVCQKLYVGQFDPARFCDSSLVPQNYPKSDFHSVYIGKVVEAYVHED